MPADAIIEEKVTPTESSTEEKTSKEESTEGSEPAKTPAEDELGSGSSKYDERFSKIYGEKMRLEKENAELKSKEPPAKEPEAKVEDDFDPKTWNEVADYIEKRQVAKQKANASKVSLEMNRMNQDISKVKEKFPDVTEEQIWDYLEKNTSTNVFEAVLNIQAGSPSNKENKEISSKIGSGSKNTTGKSSMTYEEIHNTSLDDIQLPDTK